MGKRTRRKPDQERYPNGRIKGPTTKAGRQAWDYGNAVVQQRRNLFDAQCIRDGKAADQVFDGIGQLWALDFLDGHHLDPELMRDTARLYAERYWRRNNATAPKCAKLERGDRSKGSLDDTRADLVFERWLDDLPIYERRVLEHVVVDPWFSDGTAHFVKRLVDTELIRRDRPVLTAELEIPDIDRPLLGALLRALFVLVDGSLPARFERAA